MHLGILQCCSYSPNKYEEQKMMPKVVPKLGRDSDRKDYLCRDHLDIMQDSKLSEVAVNVLGQNTRAGMMLDTSSTELTFHGARYDLVELVRCLSSFSQPLDF